MDSEDFDNDCYCEPKNPPNFRTLNCCGNCKEGADGDWCFKFNRQVYINTICDDYVKKHYPKKSGK